ncbi:MAG: hypothetical protein U0869_03215 [Chloroflexota bacterium]
MRARWSGGLVAVLGLALLVPSAVSAQTSYGWMVADNPDVFCDAPLPATMVEGDLGSTLYITDDAEIDKVTFAGALNPSVLDANWNNSDHTAVIDLSSDANAYIVWSCAPLNGEPIQQNDPQEV